MGSKFPGTRGRRDRGAAVRPNRTLAPDAASRWRYEVRRDHDTVHVTIECPEVTAEDVRYAVGRRYVVLWAPASPRLMRMVVNLPCTVRPKRHEADFRNGLFDVSMPVAVVR